MDTGHFSQTLIRGLTDKIYDRRKAAALEIEKYTTKKKYETSVWVRQLTL